MAQKTISRHDLHRLVYDKLCDADAEDIATLATKVLGDDVLYAGHGVYTMPGPMSTNEAFVIVLELAMLGAKSDFNISHTTETIEAALEIVRKVGLDLQVSERATGEVIVGKLPDGTGSFSIVDVSGDAPAFEIRVPDSYKSVVDTELVYDDRLTACAAIVDVLITEVRALKHEAASSRHVYTVYDWFTDYGTYRTWYGTPEKADEAARNGKKVTPVYTRHEK